MHKEQRLSQIIKTEEEVSNVNYQCYLSVLFSDLWLVMRVVWGFLYFWRQFRNRLHYQVARLRFAFTINTHHVKNSVCTISGVAGSSRYTCTWHTTNQNH